VTCVHHFKTVRQSYLFPGNPESPPDWLPVSSIGVFRVFSYICNFNATYWGKVSVSRYTFETIVGSRPRPQLILLGRHREQKQASLFSADQGQVQLKRKWIKYRPKQMQCRAAFKLCKLFEKK